MFQRSGSASIIHFTEDSKRTKSCKNLFPETSGFTQSFNWHPIIFRIQKPEMQQSLGQVRSRCIYALRDPCTHAVATDVWTANHSVIYITWPSRTHFSFQVCASSSYKANISNQGLVVRTCQDKKLLAGDSQTPFSQL